MHCKFNCGSYQPAFDQLYEVYKLTDALGKIYQHIKVFNVCVYLSVCVCVYNGSGQVRGAGL